MSVVHCTMAMLPANCATGHSLAGSGTSESSAYQSAPHCSRTTPTSLHHNPVDAASADCLAGRFLALILAHCTLMLHTHPPPPHPPPTQKYTHCQLCICCFPCRSLPGSDPDTPGLWVCRSSLSLTHHPYCSPLNHCQCCLPNASQVASWL